MINLPVGENVREVTRTSGLKARRDLSPLRVPGSLTAFLPPSSSSRPSTNAKFTPFSANLRLFIVSCGRQSLNDDHTSYYNEAINFITLYSKNVFLTRWLYRTTTLSSKTVALENMSRIFMETMCSWGNGAWHMAPSTAYSQHVWGFLYTYIHGIKWSVLCNFKLLNQ